MSGNIHHLEVYVSNLAASKKFWSWVLETLDYQIYQEWSQGFSYKLGNTYIVFVQTKEKFRNLKYHRCATGLNHLAFAAESKEFVDNFLEKLKDKKVKVLYSENYPSKCSDDYYAIFFEDPDRIKVELVFQTNQKTNV